MTVIVHIADVHLDSPMTGLPIYEGTPEGDIRLPTRRALCNAVEFAIEQEAGLVLVAGDLLDGNLRDTNTGLFLCSQLTRLRRAGIEVVIAYGNHDAESVVTRRMRLPDGVRVLPSSRPGTERFDALGVAVHGQSYADRAVVDDLAAGYPDPVSGMLNIGVLHTAVTGRPGHDTYAPCAVETLVSRGYDYWALGHVHAFEVLHQDPWVVFSGCVQGRGLRETGPKGVVVLRADETGVQAVEHHPVDVVRWAHVQVDASGSVDVDEVLNRIRLQLASLLDDTCRPVACRVTLRGGCPTHAELAARPIRLRDEIRNLAIDVGAGQLWVEQVECLTEGQRSAIDLAGRRDPLAQMLADVRGQGIDLADLRARTPEINALASSLPSGTLDAAHPGPEDPEWLAARFQGATRLLEGRLTEAGRAA